jgi:pimeloyl-ACP methyl ester carboxylesterase
MAVGIACGLGPTDSPKDSEGMVFLNRFGLFLGKKAPRMARALFALVTMGLSCFPGAIVDLIAVHLPGPDRQCLRRPEIRKLLADSFRESVRAGPRGPTHDIVLYSRPWEFDLKKIQKVVHLWYGERDTIVPPIMGRRLSKLIPKARLMLYPEDGHFSLIISRLEGMMEGLMEETDVQPFKRAECP